MFIQNCFYNNAELHRLVTKRRQHVYVIKTWYNGDEVELPENDYRPTYANEYYIRDHGFPEAKNVQWCINQWVHHCILVHMLDNPKTKQIDTKDCCPTRDDMRQIIMFGEDGNPDIRNLKYVDDMVDMVRFILTLESIKK